MLNATRILRALAASATLLHWSAALAATNCRSTVHQGYCADPGQVVINHTGGTYAMATPYWTMSTSGAPANNGTAEASLSAVASGNSNWTGTNIDYIIRLAGPANVLVPVHITANGDAEASDLNYAAKASFKSFFGGSRARWWSPRATCT